MLTILLACSGSGHVALPTPVSATVVEPEVVEEPEVVNPLAPTLDTTVPEAWRCAVSVELVLEDSHYRGHPTTPAQQATVEAMSPEHYEMYNSESHGESYRECTYRVIVLGQPYRYTTTWSTTWSDLPEDWCEQARDHVAANIQRTTHGCTDLHRGAYYGHDLVGL
ncbi:MAG: hypothetical protein ACI8RZ_005756 [Myxococcota bacterium]|jgi:hypothetical protein